jgi:hypothetical protein
MREEIAKPVPSTSAATGFETRDLRIRSSLNHGWFAPAELTAGW